MLWDIYGQDDYQKLRMWIFRGASGYLLVVDGTRRATLDIALQLQQTVREQVGAMPFILSSTRPTCGSNGKSISTWCPSAPAMKGG